MVFVPEPTTKKWLLWLYTPGGTGYAYQTFLKSIEVKRRQCPDYIK